MLDQTSGCQVMRRRYNADLDVPALFQLLNQAEDSLYLLRQAMPYLTDEPLVEAFSYVTSYGKRSWLIQATILFEAQQRSIYGDRTLEAISRRFEIGLHQAQKYALVWKVFFAQPDQEENVNVDAVLLDESSWYVVAATETKEPEKRLAYAQDCKQEDPGYSVASFRRESNSYPDYPILWQSGTRGPPCRSRTTIAGAPPLSLDKALLYPFW